LATIELRSSSNDRGALITIGNPQFRDRRDAGRRLGALLGRYAAERPVVLGIPRGGVPVAAEIARVLGAPLDVVVARKLGAPANPEYGIGAIAEQGAYVLSEQVVRRLGIGQAQLEQIVAGATEEMRSLTEHLRAGREPLAVAGRPAILVDDGLATGRTAHAAALCLRRRGAGKVVLAVPVAARPSVAELADSVDEVVCVYMAEDLWAIGLWYEDFKPTPEQEVLALLGAAHGAAAAPEDAGSGVDGAQSGE
jgi:putative phosphoribosyl transferase